LELIKDYDLEIHYHLGKANVVADALSQKAYCHHLITQEPQLCEEMQKLNLSVVPHSYGYNLSVEPVLDDLIKEAQKDDKRLMKIKAQTGENKAPDFSVDKDGVPWLKKRLCVPEHGHYRNTILDEAHNSAYSIHPVATKMYLDLKEKYWWTGMKGDIARFVVYCDICRRIKVEHQKPSGLLQPLPIPVWKWDEVGMDFITVLTCQSTNNVPSLQVLKQSQPSPLKRISSRDSGKQELGIQYWDRCIYRHRLVKSKP
jgi:hypothetical protein